MSQHKHPAWQRSPSIPIDRIQIHAQLGGERATLLPGAGQNRRLRLVLGRHPAPLLFRIEYHFSRCEDVLRLRGCDGDQHDAHRNQLSECESLRECIEKVRGDVLQKHVGRDAAEDQAERLAYGLSAAHLG